MSAQSANPVSICARGLAEVMKRVAESKAPSLEPAHVYCSFAYSALACFRIGMSAVRRSALTMPSSVKRAELPSARPVYRSIRLSMSNRPRLSTQRTRNERGLDQYFVLRAGSLCTLVSYPQVEMSREDLPNHAWVSTMGRIVLWPFGRTEFGCSNIPCHRCDCGQRQHRRPVIVVPRCDA